MYVLCKHFNLVCKGLEYLWILVFPEVLESTPPLGNPGHLGKTVFPAHPRSLLPPPKLGAHPAPVVSDLSGLPTLKETGPEG